MTHEIFTKYVCMKKNLSDRFLSDKILIDKKTVQQSNKNNKCFEITTDTWLDPTTNQFFYIQYIKNLIDLYLIPTDSGIFVNKDFLNVTNNSLFNVNNLLNGSIQITYTYIEGADATGKTTTVNGLAENGIITIDRCVEHITRIMNQNDKQLILQSVESFLIKNPNNKVIFLYVSDEQEHIKRVFTRERISEFDKNALSLQEKYLYTYNTLQNYDNLFLVDTYNKTPEEVQNECKQIALGKFVKTSFRKNKL